MKEEGAAMTSNSREQMTVRLPTALMEAGTIPRMRTVAKIVAEIKALDPDTEVTEFYIRQLAKEGAVPVVWAGRKALINLDDVLNLMRVGTLRTKVEAPAVGCIRRINVK